MVFVIKLSVEVAIVTIMHREYIEVLEGLIDKLTLSTVLEMLERICHKKAENLRTKWKDEASAKLWEKAARQVEQINIDI